MLGTRRQGGDGRTSTRCGNLRRWPRRSFLTVSFAAADSALPTSSSPSPSPSPTASPPSSTSNEEEVWGEKDRTGTDPNRSSQFFGDSSENADNEVFLNMRSNLGYKLPVLTLEKDFYDNTITAKIRLLHRKYGFFRRVAGDGNCFYRAFIFNYLENVVEIKDGKERRAEAARLRLRVEDAMLNCFDAALLDAFSGFEFVVNLIEHGLAAGELYQKEMNEDITTNIFPLLRSLTEIEICTRMDFYHGFLDPKDGYESVFKFCCSEVRPNNEAAGHMQIMALVDALGIPLIVENLDTALPVAQSTSPLS